MYLLKKRFLFQSPNQAEQFVSIADIYGEVRKNGIIVEMKATLTFILWRKFQIIANLLKMGRSLDDSARAAGFKLLPAEKAPREAS